MDKTAEQTTVTYNVRLPYIVNTKPIAADEKVILEWQLKEKKETKKKEQTWADEVATREKKGSARRKITMHKEVGTKSLISGFKVTARGPFHVHGG